MFPHECQADRLAVGGFVLFFQISTPKASAWVENASLHFGLFLQGVPVNPTEWWDAKWINDHVLDRMKEAGGR